MNRYFDSLGRSPVFVETDAPYLVLDRDLVIRAANPAYLAVTGRLWAQLEDRHVFDAFPDNPEDPTADGVRNATASFLTVIRDGCRSTMQVQRYDVRDRTLGDAFRMRFWSSVNSPLRDENGQVVGVLHHAEDVTPAWCAAQEPRLVATEGLLEPTKNQLATTLSRTAQQLAHAEVEASQLRNALTTRIIIEQAKGALMMLNGCNDRQAFELLRSRSRNTRRRIHEVAREVLAGISRPAVRES